jgi:hypothetical protein
MWPTYEEQRPVEIGIVSSGGGLLISGRFCTSATTMWWLNFQMNSPEKQLTGATKRNKKRKWATNTIIDSSQVLAVIRRLSTKKKMSTVLVIINGKFTQRQIKVLR